jgi:PAS domain S-box-containing protein
MMTLNSELVDCGTVEPNRQLASWLVAHRREIEAAMNARLGPAAPGAGSPESEALRRFRSFLASALARGQAPAPALDGLRLNERRVMALIEAWITAAEERSATTGGSLRRDVDPLIESFRLSIRTSTSGRKLKGRPRVTRRAVAAAIDRVADAFLAIDTDTGEIVDANPAAGSLLGVSRDALLGVDSLSFVPQSDHAGWWTELDAMTEQGETRKFGASLRDASGGPVHIDATATSFSTRGRVLALLMVRPRNLATSPTPA